MKKRDTELTEKQIFPMKRPLGIIKFNYYIYPEEIGKMIS